MAIQAIFDVLVDALAAVNIAVKVGPESLGNNVAPPCVTLVLGEETYDGPQPRFIGPPRVLDVRRVGVHAHVWGADYDDTERVLQMFIYMLHSAVGKSLEIVSGRWTQQNGAALVQFGRIYLLEFQLLIPVTVPDGAEGSATVTQTDTTDTTLPSLSFGS